MNRTIYDEIIRIYEGKNAPAILATIISIEGSAPRESGAKMLVFKSGRISGTIGGGAIEKIVMDEAISMFDRQESTRSLTYSLGESSTEALPTGMICGGKVTVFLEKIQCAERLVVYGGGHIASALAPIAAECRFNIIVVDERPEIAQKSRFGEGMDIILKNPADHAAAFEPLPKDYILIVTHNHKYDAAVLEAFMRKESNPKYIGMIGSKTKIALTLTRLKQQGIATERLQQVMSPVGLDIGADNPMEIAVAIMAEILAVKTGRLTVDTVLTMRRLRPEF